MPDQDRSATFNAPATESASPATSPAAPMSGASVVAPAAFQRKVQRRALQRKLDSERAAPDAAATHAAAERGTSGAGQPLPHLDKIQRSFGRHDVSGVQAHAGAEAGEAAQAMGAEAYATGNQVAFGKEPSLHTAAHEAAHVVQQRAGVHLKGGVGEQGDAHEQHADAVADAVVAGKSAEGLLDARAGGGGKSAASGGGAVQHKLTLHSADLPKEVAAVKAALVKYEQDYKPDGPAENVKLLQAIQAACATTGRSYKVYVTDLQREVATELAAERHRATPVAPTPTAIAPTATAHASPPTSSPAPTTALSSPAPSHEAVAPTTTAVTGAVTAATGVAPVAAGPKPAVGNVVGFEHAMGLDACRDPRSQAYVDGLMTKVMSSLDVRARTMDKTEAGIATSKATLDKLLGDFVGTTTATIAGAVGKNADVLRATMAKADGGTIREKMTVFFNFSATFQKFLLTSSDTERDAFVHKAALNADAIGKRIAALKRTNEVRPTGEFVPNAQNRLPSIYDAEHAEQQQKASRAERGGTEARARANPTVSALGADKETALSQHELDVMFKDKAEPDGHVDRDKVKNDAVTWNLGVNQWKQKEDAEFCRSLHALNLPFGAGPSGTTARIFSAAELLGAPKNDHTRLACIGYLVPIHAHSLLEVVAGAATHGVAAPDFTKLGGNVYEEITPYDPARVKTLKKQFGMDPEST